MKGLLKRVVAVSLATIGLFCATACDMESGDLNDVIDNVFKNYEEMNNTETGAYSQFKNINVQSSFLGYGYDVINDPYMDALSINYSAPIIDMQKIENAQLMMVKGTQAAWEWMDGETLEDFYKEYATKFSFNMDLGKMFSANLKLAFNGSDTAKEYWHFCKGLYNTKTFTLHLTNKLSEIRSMLSEEFKSDLLSMKADELFDKYGTHMIKDVSMGGRMEINFVYSCEETNSIGDVGLAVQSHVGFLETNSFDVELENACRTELNNKNIHCEMSVRQFGGSRSLNISTLEGIRSNFSEWTSSFDDNLENSVLSGTANENSLLGIWELLPAGNEARVQELKDEFIEQSGNKYRELQDQFKLKNVADTSWKTLDYTMERVCTVNDNMYNPNKVSNDRGENTIHTGWELGQVLINGCEEQNGKLKLKNQSDFSINYHILQNISDLPHGNNKDNLKRVYIASDTNVGVYDTPIEVVVGMGAYYIRVYYTDNITRTEKIAVNIMKDKTRGSVITLLESADLENKTIKKIELVLVYEIKMDYWESNWRCTRTFEFI